MTKKKESRLSAAASAKVLAELEELKGEHKRSDAQVTRLLDENANQRGQIVQLEKALDRARGAMTDREKDLQADCDVKDRSIRKLKMKLFGAMQDLWAARGYIARALEDDAVRELGPTVTPPVDIPTYPAPAPVSRRQGPGILAEGEPEPPPPGGFGRDRPPPPTPWFNL